MLVSISSAQRRDKRKGSGAAIYNHTGAEKAHSFYAKKVSGEASLTVEHRSRDPRAQRDAAGQFLSCFLWQQRWARVSHSSSVSGSQLPAADPGEFGVCFCSTAC